MKQVIPNRITQSVNRCRATSDESMTRRTAISTVCGRIFGRSFSARPFAPGHPCLKYTRRPPAVFASGSQLCERGELDRLPGYCSANRENPTGLPVGTQILGPYLEDATPIQFAGLLGKETRGFSPPAGYWVSTPSPKSGLKPIAFILTVGTPAVVCLK